MDENGGSDRIVIFVVFPPAMEEDVTNCFQRARVGWTILPKVWGRGEQREFHDTRAWPGHLSALIAMTGEDSVEALQTDLRRLRPASDEAEHDVPPIHAFYWKVRSML